MSARTHQSQRGSRLTRSASRSRMTTDGGTTTDHCDTEGMTEEGADENAPLVNGQGYVWAEGYGGRPGWVLCVD